MCTRERGRILKPDELTILESKRIRLRDRFLAAKAPCSICAGRLWLTERVTRWLFFSGTRLKKCWRCDGSGLEPLPRYLADGPRTLVVDYEEVRLTSERSPRRNRAE
jgi:hypothetical protein